MAAVDTEDRFEALIRDRLLPYMERLDERLNHMATKEDLAQTEGRLEKELARLEGKIDAESARLEGKIAEVKGEIAAKPSMGFIITTVISTVVSVVGLVFAAMALAPLLQP